MWIILIALAFLLAAILIKVFIKCGGKGVEEFDYQSLIILNDEESIEEKFIPLETTFNTRDIGGYKTETGEKVRRGLIYRSDRLHRLVENDIDILDRLDIKTSIDLREKSAYKRKPNNLPNRVRYIHMPIFNRASYKVIMAVLFNRKSISKVFSSSYIEQIENRAEAYGKILEVMSYKENLPLIYNCTSGKDRTGLLTALLLSLLGVNDEKIVEDYSISNYNFPKIYERFCIDYEDTLKKLIKDPSELKYMVGVDPDWMRGATEYIKENYGSVEYYLLTKAGLHKDAIDRLRDNLLERDESFSNI